MVKFQTIHNVIRPDFLVLLRLTEEQKSNEKEFDALYRACLTRFFTLIEADIYGLNQLDMYDGYDDKKDRFIEKFKETYKQICKTWNKEELQKQYFDSKLQVLIELKKKRDDLVHPKELEHIHKASDKDFQTLKTVFEDYDKFINDLMNDFFLSTKIDSSSLFGGATDIIHKSKIGLGILIPIILILGTVTTIMVINLVFVGLVICGLVILFVLSIYTGTYYKITTDNHLFIKCSFIESFDIEIKDIEWIKRTRELISSPALSIDRLEINYKGGRVLISPRDRKKFMADLRKVNPKL